MMYRVRLADVDEARARILPIWAGNLPVRGALEAKLRWFYCDGPHGPGESFVIEPSQTEEAIGSAGVGVRTMWLHDRPLRGALLADLAIERAHRSGFPALALVRAVKQHVSGTYDLGYGFPNAKAAAVYQRTGHRELGQMRRYVRVLKTASFLEPRLRVRHVARAIAKVIDHALVVDTRLRLLRARGLELAWLDQFDGRFDDLWNEARTLAPVLCERSAAFLRWRFSQQPGYQYRIAALIEASTHRMRAYAVVRNAKNGVELTDLFGVSPTEIDVLLGRLLLALRKEDHASVSFRFLGSRQIREVLARHRFAGRPGTRMVALAVGKGMENQLELADPESWYLTDLDEDS
ncbi:MAG: hypothetical protein JWP01_2420 [Myxococcales bacterium]|nr:hypothetical protein [Myxococcales bacterium]